MFLKIFHVYAYNFVIHKYSVYKSNIISRLIFLLGSVAVVVVVVVVEVVVVVVLVLVVAKIDYG